MHSMGIHTKGINALLSLVACLCDDHGICPVAAARSEVRITLPNRLAEAGTLVLAIIPQVQVLSLRSLQCL